MCGCRKNTAAPLRTQPRQLKARTLRTPEFTNNVAASGPTNFALNASAPLDQDKLRILKLQREAIRRSLGK